MRTPIRIGQMLAIGGAGHKPRVGASPAATNTEAVSAPLCEAEGGTSPRREDREAVHAGLWQHAPP
jgi:hypothetical protein